MARPGKRWVRWVQFAAGLVVMLALAWTAGPVFSGLKRSKLAPGWLLVRPPHEISALILVAGTGGETVWAGGRDGLVRLDPATGEKLALPEGGRSYGRVRALLEVEPGRVVVAHGDGIDECTGETCRLIPSSKGGWMALLKRRDGTLLASGETGLARFEGGDFRLTDSAAKLGLKDPDVLYEDSSGRLWAGSSDPAYGGLLEGAPGGVWRKVHTNGKFPHPSVSMVLEEPDGALWISTGFGREGGAVRWFKGEWTTWTKAEGLAGEKARTLYLDRAGRLWIGSEYDGIVYRTDRGFTRLTPDDGLAGWEVKAMAEDAQGNYWMGTEDGITRMPAIPAAVKEERQ
jgi:ligand-binding sensor domain-containing protein